MFCNGGESGAMYGLLLNFRQVIRLCKIFFTNWRMLGIQYVCRIWVTVACTPECFNASYKSSTTNRVSAWSLGYQ